MSPDPDGRPLTPSERASRRHRRWRLLGFAAATAAFFLICAVIAISMLEVRYGTRIFGDTHLVPGHRAAFRIAAYVLDEEDFAPNLWARLYLVPKGGKPVLLGVGAANGLGSVEVDARIPRGLAPGHYVLEAKVHTPAGDPEDARLPVTVGPPSTKAWLQTRNACEEGSHPGTGGTWEKSALCGKKDALARLYPESGHLVGSLDNRVLAWLRGAGTASGPVTWQPLSPRPAPGLERPPAPSPPSPLTLGPFGIGAFDYVPRYPRGPIRIAEKGGSATVWLRALPSQIRLRAKRVLLGPKDRLDVTAALLRGRVPLYLDLWTGGRWISTDGDVATGGAYGYTVELPRRLEGFVALRAYTSVSGPSGTYDDRVFWRAPDARTAPGLVRLAKALEALPVAKGLSSQLPHPAPDPLFAAVAGTPLPDLEALGDAGRERVGEAMLSRVEVVPEAAPLLGDTTQAKIAALEVRRKALERPLLTGLVLLGVGALLAMIVALAGDRRGLRKRLADLDIDDRVLPEDESEGAGPGRISGTESRLQGIMLLIVVASAFAGLVTLLESLRW